MEPFKLTLKLKPDSPPHLYLLTLKELMKDDNSLHPLMERTLKFMKKTRTPFVRLAGLKEMVFVPQEHLHFERSIEPETTGWAKIEWSEEEIEQFDSDPEEYLRKLFYTYENKFGYDFFNKEKQTEEDLEELKKLTTKEDKKKTKVWGGFKKK